MRYLPDLTPEEKYELEKDDEFITGLEMFLMSNLELKYAFSITADGNRRLVYTYQGRGVTRISNDAWAVGDIPTKFNENNVVWMGIPPRILGTEQAAQYLAGI